MEFQPVRGSCNQISFPKMVYVVKENNKLAMLN